MTQVQEIMVATAGGNEPFHLDLPRDWRIRQTRISVLPDSRTSSAAITIVQPSGSLSRGQLRTLAQELGRLGFTGSGKPFLVWSLAKQTRRKRPSEIYADLIRPFIDPGRIEIACTVDEVNTMIPSLVAKYMVLQEVQSLWRTSLNVALESPLDRVRQVVEATEDLRATSGKISAKRIADLYGVSVSQLAEWLKRSRQSLSKTPDADSIQEDLGYFERTARLRSALESDEGFRKWLRISNPELGGKTPLDLFEEGQWQVVSNLVDDMLTGSPS